MTKKAAAVNTKSTPVAAAVEVEIKAPTYTQEQTDQWFNDLGKLAGRARTQYKLYIEKSERLAKGVDKEAMQAEVQKLAAAGDMAKLIPLARELEQADTLLETLETRAAEYKQKYTQAAQMLKIVVDSLEYETDENFDPAAYMIENFATDDQANEIEARKRIEAAKSFEKTTGKKFVSKLDDDVSKIVNRINKEELDALHDEALLINIERTEKA